jgi:hypothetical protein
MAAAGFYPPRLLPQVLISTGPGFYEDEHHRLWMVAKLETCSHSPYCNKVSFSAPDRRSPNSYPCVLGSVVCVCVCLGRCCYYRVRIDDTGN